MAKHYKVWNWFLLPPVLKQEQPKMVNVLFFLLAKHKNIVEPWEATFQYATSNIDKSHCL